MWRILFCEVGEVKVCIFRINGSPSDNGGPGYSSSRSTPIFWGLGGNYVSLGVSGGNDETVSPRIRYFPYIMLTYIYERSSVFLHPSDRL